MKFHTAHAIAVLICQVLGGCFTAAAQPEPQASAVSTDPVPVPGPIFPITDPPAPPPIPPASSTKLASDVLYIVHWTKPFTAISSPAGLLNVVHQTGPLTIRGRFVENPTKTVTRTIKDQYIVIVEAANAGTSELLVLPVGATTETDYTRKMLESLVGPLPPPVPPVPPVPPTPVPVPGALRVLFVNESSDVSKLPAPQQLIFRSDAVRSYLDSHCAKDGKQPAYRIWDKDVDTTSVDKVWQDAMKLPRASVPWVIIGNGANGFSGPLPGTIEETMTLLRKFGGQ